MKDPVDKWIIAAFVVIASLGWLCFMVNLDSLVGWLIEEAAK